MILNYKDTDGFTRFYDDVQSVQFGHSVMWLAYKWKDDYFVDELGLEKIKVAYIDDKMIYKRSVDRDGDVFEKTWLLGEKESED